MKQVLLACLLLSLFALSSVHAADVDQDAADVVAIRALHKKLAPASYAMTLDFADPMQYRYFLRQLVRSGITRDKFPQTYREIEKTHVQHQLRAAAKTVAAKTAVDPAAFCPNNTVCPVNILSTFGAPAANPQNFSVTAFSSIPASPQYAMNSIGIYDEAGKAFAEPVSVQQMGTGYDIVNVNSGTAPSPTLSPTIHAQGVWYYIPVDGGGIPGNFFAQLNQGENPTIVNTSPTNLKHNPQIKICVTRQDADCDYRYEATGNQYIVKFPVAGNVTYPAAIQADGQGHPMNGVSNVQISAPVQGQGGGCKPLPIGTNLVTAATVSNRVVTWNIDPAQFGVATPCFPSNTTVIYDLMLTVFDVNNVPYVIAITSKQGNPQANLVRIPPTIVVYGCLAAGTRVTMADETKKAIETIRVGERIRSNLDRIPLTVDNYTKGYEKPPMVAITTSKGHSLMLTDGHPVITERGVVAARDLRLGDTVITEDGYLPLMSIERPTFDGDVWNLDVGLPADGVRLTDTNTTFFANGILVGDGHMQSQTERAHFESREEIMKRIGEKWRVDFLNAEGLAQQRKRSGR